MYLLGGGCVSSFLVSLSPQEANQFLSRHRRANQVFEETKQGHLERECVEERCTKEEAREVFENDPETVSVMRSRQKLWFFSLACVQVSSPTLAPFPPALSIKTPHLKKNLLKSLLLHKHVHI